MSTPDDLAETVKEVEALDRRIVAAQADVRDYGALKAALDDGVAQLGRLDIVAANAGIFSFGTLDELSETAWQDMIDTNLTGVWHTAKAAIPHLRAAGGGAIILTSSALGLEGMPNVGHYVAAKHGVVGLMRTLALELAPDMIRVNSLHPTTVNTDMVQNAATYAADRGRPAGGRADPSGGGGALPDDQRAADPVRGAYRHLQRAAVARLRRGALRHRRHAAHRRRRTGQVAPRINSTTGQVQRDISNAVLFLASDEARYITGVTLPAGAGSVTK